MLPVFWFCFQDCCKKISNVSEFSLRIIKFFISVLCDSLNTLFKTEMGLFKELFSLLCVETSIFLLNASKMVRLNSFLFPMTLFTIVLLSKTSWTGNTVFLSPPITTLSIIPKQLLFGKSLRNNKITRWFWNLPVLS